MNSILDGQLLLHYISRTLRENGPEFPLAIQKMSKFEKNNSGVAINGLFNSTKGIIQLADQSIMNSVASKFTN